MRKLLVFIGLMTSLIQAKAQYVSLSNDEVITMRKVIDRDTAYQRVFSSFRSAAENALSATPNPISEILSQGLLEGNPAKTASLKAVQDAYKVYALGLMYQYSGKKDYLNKATEFLMAWAKINKATGDPINETKLEDMVTGYDLIRRDIPNYNRGFIDAWLESIADAEVNSASAKPGRGTAINNWNSHRIKMITLIAYTIHNKKYDAVITGELEKQLAVNLNADGTTLDFMERDAFHYHTYDLEPLLATCIALYRATGKNYFDYQTPKGASLRKCVDFMVPFMTGEKTHGEFVNSTVAFDKARAKNGEKGYAAGTLFEPKSGIFTLSLANYFDEDYINAVWQAAKNRNYANWQLVLNKIRKKPKRL